MKGDHEPTCMCDDCIKRRVRAEVQKRETDIAQRAYEKRRGAPIGTVSVAEALKTRS